jgi:hypothetical protein
VLALVLVVVLDPLLMWSRFCGPVSGKRFVPEGPSNRSLAAYCQGMQETEPVP